MNAKIGYRPSYTWRSILESRKIIEAGSRWRIGDGSKIHIWKDRWVPTPSTFRVVSPKNFLEEDAMVSELIDPVTHCWKSPVIDAVSWSMKQRLSKGSHWVCCLWKIS